MDPKVKQTTLMTCPSLLTLEMTEKHQTPIKNNARNRYSNYRNAHQTLYYTLL